MHTWTLGLRSSIWTGKGYAPELSTHWLLDNGFILGRITTLFRNISWPSNYSMSAPMFWGPMSDHIGRRPISAACLLILSLSCVGLALVPTSDFWLLMLLRCLQASGSASTIAIGASSLYETGKNLLISSKLTEFRRRGRSWRHIKSGRARRVFRNFFPWSYCQLKRSMLQL